MKYCVDADVLIQASRKAYPFDLVPGFWSAFAGAADNGDIFVVHAVYREIVGAEDELADWLKARKSSILHDERGDQGVVAELNRIDGALRARQPKFNPTAINEYYGCADSWVVTYASAYGHTVVTEEIAEPLRKKRVKIPDVCRLPGVGVPSMTTQDLMRVLGMKLVVG